MQHGTDIVTYDLVSYIGSPTIDYRSENGKIHWLLWPSQQQYHVMNEHCLYGAPKAPQFVISSTNRKRLYEYSWRSVLCHSGYCREHIRERFPRTSICISVRHIWKWKNTGAGDLMKRRGKQHCTRMVHATMDVELCYKASKNITTHQTFNKTS